jgi:hypothetical protein
MYIGKNGKLNHKDTKTQFFMMKIWNKKINIMKSGYRSRSKITGTFHCGLRGTSSSAASLQSAAALLLSGEDGFSLGYLRIKVPLISSQLHSRRSIYDLTSMMKKRFLCVFVSLWLTDLNNRNYEATAW